jgi:inositol-phosphate phosphatase / L-galactose 1-phosphate phosphatase / histidinol-phosphatase
MTVSPDTIALAHELADIARPIALKYFRTEGLKIEHKDAEQPVTIADREIETVMREMIGKKFPDHGIVGEEYGRTNPDAEWQWILDPIDGTKAFSTGRVNFGTLIALHHAQDGFVLGLCDQAFTKDRWLSIKGQKTEWNGKPVKMRNTRTIKDAIFACTDPLRLPEHAFNLVRMIRKQSYMNVFGGDCINYCLLASGFVDLIIEGRQEVHDIAPFVPMIEAGGGKITQLNGKPILFGKNDDIVLVASSPELHAEILALLQNI